MRFAGKVVLVAGGTGGLGRAVAEAFLREGAHVAVTYRNRVEFDALVTSAGEMASQLEGFAVDVTDEAVVRMCVSALAAQRGSLDVLVNAVGGYAGGAPLWETGTDVLERMVALHVRATYVLCRSAVAEMVKAGSGAIVNVASRAAFDHAAGAAAYAGTKAAAVAIIDSLAADLKGKGVRANSVAPGIIDTAANRKAMPDADFSKWPKPEEIAEVVLWLASDAAKLVNGATVPV
ncbi:MAG: SDR family NAD(P)-dependent oxidoreductase [Terracidiphilus sp.]|nr:SDR family NAD(P)-dependent oxidoreductase [Terracidiphilus sp.]